MPANLHSKAAVKVADEVWVATALLHRENPARRDFTVAEIVARAAREKLSAELRPGVYVHAQQHCVANRPPNPGRHRMLFETGKNTRRLFRPGDAFHPDRAEGKITPEREHLPEKYRSLLDWYHSRFKPEGEAAVSADPLMELRGMWKGLWKDEKPDAYVRRLREDWA